MVLEKEPPEVEKREASIEDPPASRKAVHDPPEPCFVVGIGASAGGQGALEQLFSVMPTDCGLAFVLIMHLPSQGPSFLSEMLSRYTAMQVVTAEDEMPLLPNRVHVIPAGKELTLNHNALRLHLETRNDRAYHPIDRFFLSLAAAPNPGRSIAVILSGRGADGAVGVKGVRDAGGIVFVQDPSTASSPAMPESAIAADAATLVLAPEEIARKIAEIASAACAICAEQACRPVTLEGELERVFAVVKERTGHDFSAYKRNTVIRRIERRMMLNDVGGIGKYVALLRENPQEAEALCKEILIGVTSFFRDPEAFEFLRREILPRIFDQRDPEDTVRIWHACCATGEEVYSMAMLVREYLDQHPPGTRVQIFATDLDEAAIAQARAGTYEDEIRAEVGEERLAAFFTRVDGRWKVAKLLREMVVFAQHSVIKDPPFSRIDLLVCRNFLIYLNPDMQKRLIALFHYVLQPGGVLFLGSAEAIGEGSELFFTIEKKWKIFGRRDAGEGRRDPLPVISSVRLPQELRPPRAATGEQTGPAALGEQALLERYAQPSVVVNEKYEVVHFFSRTSRFLELPDGEPTRELLKMAREELRPPLRAAIYKAFSHGVPVSFEGITLGTGAEAIVVNIVAQPLHPPSPAEKLILVIFETPPCPPVSPTGAADEVRTEEDGSGLMLVQQLEEQLRLTHEQLRLAMDQLEAANEGYITTSEELDSISEEYQSANEELQSTNEELVTSKEELQALNEELVTLNAELEGKVGELKAASSDMENLLAGSGIATVFLDSYLALRGFTPAAAEIFHLIQSDRGRPFQHFAGKVDWATFSSDAEAVLAGEPFTEREVCFGERCHLKRLLPYRNAEGTVAGLVVTLIDITERKRVEDALRDSELRFSTLFNRASVPAALSRFPDGIFVDVNDACAELFGLSKEEMIGRSSVELGINRNRDARARTIEEIERRGAVVNLEQTLYSASGERLTVLLNVTVIELAGERFALTCLQDITERKRAEAQLAESKMKLEAALESMTEAVSISDTDGRLVDFNGTFATYHKFRNKEECLKSLGEYPDLLELYLPDGRPAPVDQWPVTRALRGETATSDEYALHRKDTGERWVGSYSYAPIRDRHGTVTGAVVAARDVTERKKAEAAVRESEERYRSLVEGAHTAIFINRNNVIEYANPAAVALFGAESADAVIGRSPFEFIAPEMHAVVRERIAIVLKGGKVPLIESKMVQLSGQVRVVDATAVGFTDHRGRAIQVMMHDVTERKEAEAALKESETLFRTLADAIPHLCWMADAGGEVFWYNRRWFQYTGTTPEEMAGGGWHAVHDAGVLPSVLERWQASLAAGTPFEMVFPLRGADGVFRPFLTRGLPVRDREGKVVRWFGTNTDITQQRNAEEALRQAKEAAEAATRAKTQFLANMSHELRTPMTGVLGMLDLVMHGRLRGEERELLRAARNSAKSLLRILNDILDLTKIESGKLTMEEKPFPLRQCVEHTFNILLPVARSKGLEFTCTVAAEVPATVVGDQIRLSQVLTNLAGNAVKFTESGQVELVVTAGDRVEDGKREITFSVADTGIGIPDSKKDRLFREFSQVDDSHSRSYGGTGLGLVISREIVERMGGRITFSSQEGVGSIFSFTVPLAEGEPSLDEAQPQEAVTETSAHPAQGRRARILIAEDDPTIREVLSRMLLRCDYEIAIAENGRQAVQMWEEGEFDLILMDVQMPRMNGFEATAAIRGKERMHGGHIPIVAMTAHALKEDETRCLEAGMDRYISKPIDFAACQQVIQELLWGFEVIP